MGGVKGLFPISRLRISNVNKSVNSCLFPENVSKVLYLAHSHLLGAHLGREKTYDVFSAASTGQGSREPWRNTLDTVKSTLLK